MVAATGGDDAAAEAVTCDGDGDGDGEAQIPIIDHRRLLLELDHGGEESARLHRACQDWGLCQVSSFVGSQFPLHTGLCCNCNAYNPLNATNLAKTVNFLLWYYICLIILILARIALLFICS